MVSHPKHDSSAEIELTQYPDSVLDLLTTKDGTVGGLFDGYNLKPVEGLFLGTSPEAIRATLWDSLKNETKRKLIAQVSVQKALKSTFFSDRKLPNLKIRDEISLPLSKLMGSPELNPFLGGAEALPNGKFPIGRFLRNPEFMGPNQASNSTELHLRAKISAGEVLRSAWALEKMLETQRTHLHIHIVADLPVGKLLADAEGTAAAVTDFYRRVNAVLEFTGIEDLGGTIGRVGNAQATYWDNLSDTNLTAAYDYLRRAKYGTTSPLGSRLKQGYAGFRGSDTYDEPHLFGFEIRAIQRDSELERTAELLDTVQWALSGESYGIDGPEMKAWAAAVYPNQTLRDAIGRSWYDQDIPDLLEIAQPKVQALMASDENRKKVESQKHVFYNGMHDSFADEMKMLIHPWHNDPLFYRHPAVQEKIKEAQVKALASFLSGDMDRNVAVSHFLSNSKIRLAMEKSISSPPQEVIPEVYGALGLPRSEAVPKPNESSPLSTP